MRARRADRQGSVPIGYEALADSTMVMRGTIASAYGLALMLLDCLFQHVDDKLVE
jgi:hypothetical protein